ncbi:HAD-IC family P-type ATPase [Microbacterium sp. A196]|uniref:HAD-IC family P-type ATPase n=1 Tax=Microbacterium sp. A196 TaxID=3457320 RepID=UPI003FD5DFC6
MLIGHELPAWTTWISAALGTVMYVWGGAPFLTGAVHELRTRAPGMMLLIGLAITVAFLASWGATLGLLHHELEFWWELALLVVIMLLGHWIEMRSLAQTTSALDSLSALLPDEAERVDGDTTVIVAPADLRIGDVVVVRPGGRVPADGTVLQGAASMDESMITGIHPVESGDDDRMLALAAAAESDSEHPLARAIVNAAAHLEVPRSSGFSSSPAIGVRAEVDGHVVQVGGPYLLDQEGADELPIADDWRADGAIILHVLIDGRVAGALRLADEIRPESREAIDALHARGVQVVMITGDAEAVASSVASELGIDRYFAGVRPQDKAATVKNLQDEGRMVAMVGDGVNDAPALAQADVGIAIGAGTDVAIASAGVILASDDPRAVLSVIELSRASYRKMTQNLWWAAGYNLISVPLAAGVLAPIGFVMPMSVGAILMSLSTVVVALNAQLLRRLDIRPEKVIERR